MADFTSSIILLSANHTNLSHIEPFYKIIWVFQISWWKYDVVIWCIVSKVIEVVEYVNRTMDFLSWLKLLLKPQQIDISRCVSLICMGILIAEHSISGQPLKMCPIHVSHHDWL